MNMGKYIVSAWRPPLLHAFFRRAFSDCRTNQARLIAMAGTLFLCGVLPPSAQARPLEEIRQSGEIRICVTPGIQGEYYARMGTALAEHLHVQAKIRHLASWDQQFHNDRGLTDKTATYTPQLLATGECDFYPNDLVMAEWRARMMDIIPFYQTRIVVIVKKERAANFRSIQDLKGRTVSVMKGTTYHSWVEERNKSDFADNPMRIRFVEKLEDRTSLSGGVDFTLENADVAFAQTLRKDATVQIAFAVGPLLQVGWGFRKEDQTLQGAVKEFFAVQLQKAGSRFDQIWQEKRNIRLSEFTLMMSNIPVPGAMETNR